MNEMSKSEEQVMISIWKSAEAPTLKTVLVDVNAAFHHEWAPQTVSTFLARLFKKGYVTRERKGRSVIYYPAIDMKEYRKEKLAHLLNELYDKDTEMLKADL